MVFGIFNKYFKKLNKSDSTKLQKLEILFVKYVLIRLEEDELITSKFNISSEVEKVAVDELKSVLNSLGKTRLSKYKEEFVNKYLLYGNK